MNDLSFDHEYHIYMVCGGRLYANPHMARIYNIVCLKKMCQFELLLLESLSKVEFLMK